MMSAGVCGLTSLFAAGAGVAGFDVLATGMICASADASWMGAETGLARGTGTASADLAGTAAAVRPAGEGLAGEAATAPLASSWAAAELPLYSEAGRLG